MTSRDVIIHDNLLATQKSNITFGLTGAAAEHTGVRLNPWLCCMGGIGWMVDSVVDLDIGDFEWVNSFQATDIEPIFLRVGSALMVCIDSADGAKEMPRNVRIELILAQKLLACYDSQTGQ